MFLAIIFWVFLLISALGGSYGLVAQPYPLRGGWILIHLLLGILGWVAFRAAMLA